MESSSSLMNYGPKSIEEEVYMSGPKTHNKLEELISTLPRGNGLMSGLYVYQYEGFWHNSFILEGLLSAQEHFKPKPNDTILSSAPKSGTTWLKALCFAIVTRSHYDDSTNPLLTTMPHECVFNMEGALAHNSDLRNDNIPLASPKGVESCCKEPICLEDAFELFCEGISSFGPYWNNVLGYWKASLELPEKILFLKYEDLKNKTLFYVKKMAEFMGHPFSVEEEVQGMAQKIVDRCSFENIRNLEVNKNGSFGSHRHVLIQNSSFFRKGEVGDWKNYLTPMMASRLDQITEQKLKSSGLTFNVPSNA
uniref:Sulfotransferase n=1 Tax=Fagus sylvatica TaxID=28930 RepID=A0A2N9HUC0_FAGSY